MGTKQGAKASMARAKHPTRSSGRASRQTVGPTKKSIACQKCHARKVRCSGSLPCNNCRSASDCVYPQRDRQVTVQQSYIDNLLQEIEDLRAGQPESDNSDPPAVHHEAAPLITENADEMPRNPLLEDRPWFAHMRTSAAPIWIGEASDAAFATRFRQTVAVTPDTACHIPRTQYVTDESLLDVASKIPPWPSSSRARLLVEAALRSLCRCYHIIRRSDVLTNLEQLETNDGCSQDNGLKCKMWAIFAIGELYTTKSGSFGEGFPGLAYFAHASSMLRVISERPHLDSIETMLLLSLYSLELNRRHSAYTLVGYCIRLATVMGLHFNIDKSYIADPGLREHRNRVWWTAYVFDRMWSSKIGLPASISDEEISVDLPSSVAGSNTEDFVDHEYLIANTNLARLAGRINTCIYSRKAQTGRFLSGVQDVLKSLHDWAQKLPAHLQIDTNKPAKSVGRPVSLHLSFNQCLILATRPILLHALRVHLLRGETAATKIPDTAEAIAMTCIRCARHSCSLLTECWINGTFHVFDYFYTQYLFSAATVLAISGLLGWKDYSSDADSFEIAAEFLTQLQQSGNCAAKEFSSHIESIKAIIRDSQSPSDTNHPPAAQLDLAERLDTSSNPNMVPTMTAETALAEPSLQQFLSEGDLDMEFLDSQFLIEDMQGIFGYLNEPAV